MKNSVMAGSMHGNKGEEHATVVTFHGKNGALDKTHLLTSDNRRYTCDAIKASVFLGVRHFTSMAVLHVGHD